MKKLIFLIFMACFVACTKYEKIEDFPIESPKLVANSIFKEGEPFTFKISRSLSVLDNAQLNHITDAQLILFRNQVAVDTIQGSDDDIIYRSHVLPERGYNYHIKVSHPAYNPIFSQQEELPASVLINNFQCELIDSVTTSNNHWHTDYVETIISNYVLDCSLTLLDQGVTDNIYSLGIMKLDSLLTPGNNGSNWFMGPNYILLSDDPSLINNTGIGNNGMKMDRLFFDNQSFAGKEYTFNFTIDDNDWGTTLHRKYTLLIYSYSHSSYMYSRTRNFGYFWQSTPFDEPRSVYSNIEGGYGIFSGIELKEIPLGR